MVTHDVNTSQKMKNKSRLSTEKNMKYLKIKPLHEERVSNVFLARNHKSILEISVLS